MLEAQLWNQALADEEKVFWIRESADKEKAIINALKLLSKNISDFAGGLAALLEKEMGMKFDRFGNCMLSCYTGDRQYNLHIDNPHGEEEDDDSGLPDNGMRLTC